MEELKELLEKIENKENKENTHLFGVEYFEICKDIDLAVYGRGYEFRRAEDFGNSRGLGPPLRLQEVVEEVGYSTLKARLEEILSKEEESVPVGDTHGMVLSDKDCDYSDLEEFGTITIEMKSEGLRIETTGFKYAEGSCRQSVTKTLCWLRDVLSSQIEAEKRIPGGTIVCSVD